MNLFRNYHIRNFNIRLVLFTMALTIMGLLVIGSANEAYQTRQVEGMLIGLGFMTVLSVISYSFLLKLHWLAYAGANIMLVIVLFFGDSTAGATRWIDLDFVRFQPSELAKIFLIMFFARFFMDVKEEINTKKIFFLTALLCALPLGLIFLEPDLSTTVVTFIMIAGMMFYTGLSYKIVIPVVAAAFGFASYIIIQVLRGAENVLFAYQGNRISAWLRPDENPAGSYQQQNAIMAIGSGRLFGKGLNNTAIDSVKNGNYISEGQTDFIFAIAGEELGFIGSIILIILMLLISFECLRTARLARDFAGELICAGMAILISTQSFVNIGVVTGLLPNTGLTLPFVSYGLTSLVSLFMGIGVVLNVSLQARKY